MCGQSCLKSRYVALWLWCRNNMVSKDALFGIKLIYYFKTTSKSSLWSSHLGTGFNGHTHTSQWQLHSHLKSEARKSSAFSMIHLHPSSFVSFFLLFFFVFTFPSGAGTRCTALLFFLVWVDQALSTLKKVCHVLLLCSFPKHTLPTLAGSWEKDDFI